MVNSTKVVQKRNDLILINLNLKIPTEKIKLEKPFLRCSLVLKILFKISNRTFWKIGYGTENKIGSVGI